MTTQNANNGIPATQEDVRDSDGAIVGTSAEALVLTTQIPVSGANNHTFDFGFLLVLQIIMRSVMMVQIL